MENKTTIQHPAFKIASLIICTGLAALVTALVKFPIPKTNGYFNFVDALVYFTGFTFGPLTGLIAGGIGPAIADIASPYAIWAPVTILAHGLQGLIAGMIMILFRKKDSPSLIAYVITGLIGSVLMVGIYFLGGSIIEGMAVTATQIPFNLLQSIGGIVLAIPLCKAVQAAWPPVRQYRF
ncbi:MAG: ECF transporter S component [Spirochaetales bacterium]|nr:ECF transporter S component [Spirochaetales bacterium]